MTYEERAAVMRLIADHLNETEKTGAWLEDQDRYLLVEAYAKLAEV